MSYGEEKLAAFRRFLSGKSITVTEAWPLFYASHPQYKKRASPSVKASRKSKSPMRRKSPKKSKSPMRRKSPKKSKSPMRRKSPKKSKSPMRRKSPRSKSACTRKSRNACTRRGSLCNPLSGRCILPSTVGSLRLKLNRRKSPKRR